jgi:hypothetical protein
MANREEDQKRRGQPAPPPRPATSPRRGGAGESAFELTPVPGRSRPENPWDDAAPTRPGLGGPPSRPPAAPRASAGAPGPATPLQKRLLSSSFDDEEPTHVDVRLGQRLRAELDEPRGQSRAYDGATPAEEVTATESWKAVAAPVQSRPGRRSPALYANVIDQFAPAANPRYAPDPGGRSRAHVFVWDLSRAMGCEVPHFVKGRELSLLETVDFVRREAPLRGWRRLDAAGAVAAADRGEPVLAVPRDPRQRLVAVVRPGGPGPDGQPRVASANLSRSNDLSAAVALARVCEYFGHE